MMLSRVIFPGHPDSVYVPFTVFDRVLSPGHVGADKWDAGLAFVFGVQNDVRSCRNPEVTDEPLLSERCQNDRAQLGSTWSQE